MQKGENTGIAHSVDSREVVKCIQSTSLQYLYTQQSKEEKNGREEDDQLFTRKLQLLKYYKNAFEKGLGGIIRVHLVLPHAPKKHKSYI